MTLKASGVKVVPISLIEEVNRSGPVQIENREELDLLLQFQHEIGTILYFSIEGLREKIILDPQWLIDAQKSLITAEMFIKMKPAITKRWNEFKKKGKLTQELIDAVWTKENKPEFHDNKEHILLLMEHLNIIAKPKSFSTDGNTVTMENYFLEPCMLRTTTPKEVISPKSIPNMESLSVLCYVFTGNFLPSPIFHHLLAACMNHWAIAKKKNSEDLIFCGSCVFDLDSHHGLTVFFIDYIIFAQVTKMSTTEKTPSSKLCIEVREFITIILFNIIGYLGQNLRFELSIRCPKSDGYSEDCLLPFANLKENVDYLCHFHDEPHMIVCYEVLKFWYQEEDQLEYNGHHVWVDVKDMGPQLSHRMAKAVEMAHVVLVCMSDRYKKSKNCRKEATYADEKNKTVIPLKMEQDFTRDGWLGILTADKTSISQ
ncbi:hypothetical protein CHS0354_019099 [Potamilus streckersoni]|uniref:Uncharacterized protein n=1 Tax=Potamilus streckersoni TaxID=2493646 RepID=A0AAE0VH07_9BIVA|nr:hypothetical protein CHS0354_019099 [Potamilus streckersoni]